MSATGAGAVEKAFKRVIDVGDGRPLTYFGDTQQEADDAAAAAQTELVKHARKLERENRELRAQSVIARPKAIPLRTRREFTPRNPSNDEAYEISRLLQTPGGLVQAVDQLIEMRTGLRPAEMAARENDRERDRFSADVKAALLQMASGHPEFVRCAENSKRIADYLETNGLDWTEPDNYEIAFQELAEAGALELRANGNGSAANRGTEPEGATERGGDSPGAAGGRGGGDSPHVRVRERTIASTALGGRGGGAPRGGTPGPKMPSAEEIRRMPRVELQQKIATDAAFRKHIESLPADQL